MDYFFVGLIYMETLTAFIEEIRNEWWYENLNLSPSEILNNVNKLYKIKNPASSDTIYEAPILTLIAKTGTNSDIVISAMKFILSKNPDVNISDTLGRNVLSVLIRNRNVKRTGVYMGLIRNILSMGLDVNVLDKEGRTVFYYAFMEENPVIFDIIKSKLDVNKVGYDGTPIHISLNGFMKKVYYEREYSTTTFTNTRLEDKNIDIIYAKSVLKKLMTLNPDLSIKSKSGTIFDLIEEMKSFIPESNIKDMINILKNSSRINSTTQQLVKAIKQQKQPPYKWQAICSEFGNNNLQTLKELAVLHGITPGDMSKRQLCKALAIQTEKLKNPTDCANDTSILGDDIKDIPAYLLYSFEEKGKRYCFNIVELMEYINKGNKTNPFTRQPLDIKKIKDRFEILKKMLNENALGMVNIIEQIRNNPIMDKNTILKLAITNLTAGMSYPPTVDQIMKFNNNQLKTVVEYINNNPIFPKYRGDISLDKVMSFLTGAITGENRDLKLVALEQYLLDANTGDSSASSSRRSSNTGGSSSRRSSTASRTAPRTTSFNEIVRQIKEENSPPESENEAWELLYRYLDREPTDREVAILWDHTADW